MELITTQASRRIKTYKRIISSTKGSSCQD